MKLCHMSYFIAVVWKWHLFFKMPVESRMCKLKIEKKGGTPDREWTLHHSQISPFLNQSILLPISWNKYRLHNRKHAEYWRERIHPSNHQTFQSFLGLPENNTVANLPILTRTQNKQTFALLPSGNLLSVKITGGAAQCQLWCNRTDLQSPETTGKHKEFKDEREREIQAGTSDDEDDEET